MNVTIYHNPRCSKSRQTLELIKSQNIDPTVIEYLKDTPDAKTLNKIITDIGLKSARELMRTKENDYKTNSLKNEFSEDKLIEAMIKNPKLIERPIVITDKGTRLGRPPENILDIL